MAESDAVRVQLAVDGAIGGDVEPIAAFLALDVVWRGVERATCDGGLPPS